MSKSNRFKGKWDNELQCRNSTLERDVDLHLRTQGLSERHEPKQSMKFMPSTTKAQRKALKELKATAHIRAKYGEDYNPLTTKASAIERGAAKILALISTVTHAHPESIYG